MIFNKIHIKKATFQSSGSTFRIHIRVFTLLCLLSCFIPYFIFGQVDNQIGTSTDTSIDTTSQLGDTASKQANSIHLLFFSHKKYQITNHLGNVLVTVSDRKIANNFDINPNPNVHSPIMIKGYKADVISATDYYPFGMTMPNRNFNHSDYEFGFNGKMDDKEWDKQDYGMRYYDTRKCRFESVDPIAYKYPELSPCQFASNRPIDGVDLDGLE